MEVPLSFWGYLIFVVKMLISFVIPAYNVAAYIKSCIESIFALDMRGHTFEVIVVDDGSSDDTANVLQKCMEEYPLKIITQDNGGLSVARNVGMSYANGKYIAFVDADDELICTSDLSLLLSLMEREIVDIIGVNVRQRDFLRNERPYRRYVPSYGRVYSPAYTFMTGRNVFPCVWAYVFRRAFLDKEKLEFCPLLIHEDEEFTPRALALAHSFMAVDVDWYLRILREESITTTTDRVKQKQGIRDMLRVIRYLTELGKEASYIETSLSCKLDFLVVDILLLLHSQGHSRDFRLEVLGELRKMNRFPMRWRWELKYIIFNLWTRIFL